MTLIRQKMVKCHKAVFVDNTVLNPAFYLAPIQKVRVNFYLERRDSLGIPKLS